jgi:hypothetical protein
MRYSVIILLLLSVVYGQEAAAPAPKSAEATALENSMREYERRFKAMMKLKRDSLDMLVQSRQIDPLELEVRKSELDSLEMVFKKKMLQILSTRSAQAPAERQLTPEEIQAARMRTDTAGRIIIVGEQPGTELEVEDSLAELSPFRQFMARNFSSSMGTIEQVGSLEMGMNFMLRNDPRFPHEGGRRFHIGNAGFRLGILFPLRFPGIASYYRVRVMFHNATLSDVDTVDYTYLTGTNELVVGKNFFIRNQPFEYIPLVAVGYNNGIIVEKVLNAGISGREVHYFWFWHIGMMIKRHIEIQNQRMAIGLSVNFERAFVADEDTKRRLSICALFSY